LHSYFRSFKVKEERKLVSAGLTQYLPHCTISATLWQNFWGIATKMRVTVRADLSLYAKCDPTALNIEAVCDPNPFRLVG